MLTLNDGRSELWQWDTGRKLTVDADCSQVHFSNKVFGRSIDVDVLDGVAIIPDVLLQTDKDLFAWAFVGTPENGYTKISKVFKVNRRNKPSDYVFTPPEQTTLGEILERLDDLESIQDPDAIKNAVDDYLANNPIMVKETDPTVPEWAKQPTPPDVKIPDKLPNPHSITFTGAVDASYDGSNPVEIKIPDSGGNADCVGVEPADGDIPQVYLTGVDGADAPITKTEVDFKLHYVSKTEEFTAFCTLKLQGDSSASTAYKKKNYTVKMFSDATHETKLKKEFRDWGFSTNKYILKANWIDATHARQMVAYDIWSKIVKTREGYADSVEATLPNQGTSDGFPVIVYINDTYYGIYNWILPKSDALFGVDEDDANQFVIYGQTNTDGVFRKTANNFRALWSGTDVDNWEIEVGTNSNIVKTAVNNFTNFVMTATDEEFYANLDNYCNVKSLIDGYLFDYYLCGIDALAQNMILICRDGATFTLGVWDRDSTFGLWWNGSRMVSTSYRCPEDYQEPFSLLWARLEGTFYNELKARKAELRADGAPLSFANIVGTFDNFVHNIGDDRYDENNTAYAQPSKGIATKKQFREFVRDRLAYVDSCVDNFGTVIKCADISLTESSVEITEGNHTLTAVLVPSATTQEIEWVSNDESILTVKDGVITPVAIGSATVTATCGQYSATCAVTVASIEEVPCTGITLSATELTFDGEGTQTLTATVTPDGCTDAITWESDNTSVATVDDGVVTAIANGSATITAKCGEYSASCTVAVSGIDSSEEIVDSEIDYTLNALAGVQWLENTSINSSTGELKTAEGEYATDEKCALQAGAVYSVNNGSGGTYPGFAFFDSNDSFRYYIENINVGFVASRSMKILAKVYAGTNSVTPENLTVTPVDNRTTASEYKKITLSDYNWSLNNNNQMECVIESVPVYTSANISFDVLYTHKVIAIYHRKDCDVFYHHVYNGNTYLVYVGTKTEDEFTAWLTEKKPYIEFNPHLNTDL